MDVNACVLSHIDRLEHENISAIILTPKKDFLLYTAMRRSLNRAADHKYCPYHWGDGTAGSSLGSHPATSFSNFSMFRSDKGCSKHQKLVFSLSCYSTKESLKGNEDCRCFCFPIRNVYLVGVTEEAWHCHCVLSSCCDG